MPRRDQIGYDETHAAYYNTETGSREAAGGVPHSSIEHDKAFAISSAFNPGTKNTISTPTDNLIHESGRLQLNTYQAFVRNMMNPLSDLRSLLLVHMTGTGKTITALATATEYVRQYQPNRESPSVSSIIVLGFTQDIFKKEILAHPEFAFVNIDESAELKVLEQQMHESPAIAEQYHSKRRKYQRRLFRKDIKGIYQFYGYRQLVNRIIDMSDVQTMMKKQSIVDVNELEIDTRLLKAWIRRGAVRINEPFIRTLARSLIICDEIHNLYTDRGLNTYGVAIQTVFDYFYSTLKPTDADYGSVRSLLLSATPLTSTATEVIPLIALLTGDELPQQEIFKHTNGVDQLTQAGSSKIRQMLAARVSYIMDDNPREYPTSSFQGTVIKDIQYVRFVRSKPTGHQMQSLVKWTPRNNIMDEGGTNMIKDITFPAVKGAPNGVYFSKNIGELADLPRAVAVHKTSAGFYASNIFQLSELGKYSCKYARLIQMCLDMKGTEHGKMFVYHPFVQGSGIDLLVSIFIANGFVLDGDVPAKDSICMKCSASYGKHPDAHEFTPIRFTFVTGALAKSTMAARLNAFNSDANLYGERIKIILGSRAMREGHTLKACRHVIVAHEPSSISELVQIIGRAVRKHVHAMLPPAMRTVQIHILTTDISTINPVQSDRSANEETAYKMKVLQFSQINRVERIMYDVSIDYLINFRFKLRETPPLLGEPYSLDMVGYNRYEKLLTTAYRDMRNGIAPSGIHTNRFNVFYFEGEVKLVAMIIKRIILDHQPVIAIAQIKDIIREPPFHVEYNTKLISDEAIAVSINMICFQRDALRMITPANAMSLTDALFDQTSTIIDTNGHEYKIVCIGHPLCEEAYLTKRLVSAIAEGDNSIIDSFKQSSRVSMNKPIDLKDLSGRWAATIQIDEVIADLKKAAANKKRAADNKDMEHTLTTLPNKIHSQLAEWIIEIAIRHAIQKRRVASDDLALAVILAEFYKSKRLLIIVSDLKHTRIYDRLKRYNVDTGSSWHSKGAKPSTASMPVGHMIDDSMRICLPADQSWIGLHSIGDGVQATHPYQFYIYEERVGNTLAVATKIKQLSNQKAKGITMAFCQKTELDAVAKVFKIDGKAFAHKEALIKKIETAAWAMQAKIHPKRVIYRLVDM